MYTFDTSNNRRKTNRRFRILAIIIFVLIVLLVGVSVTLFRTRGFEQTTREVLLARAVSEAGDAQTTVYRLTQSSGTNSMALLANVRSHIYCLQSLNTIAANIYGAGTIIVDPELLNKCITTLDLADVRLQAGNVLTEQFTVLRDEVNDVAAVFNLY